MTADDASSKQGKPLSPLTYKADALFAGDTFTGALATDADIHTVDTYTITLGTLSAGANYTIVFTPGTYTVYAKDTLTPNGATQGTTYDGEGHDFTVSFDVEPITGTAVVVTYRLSGTEDEFSSNRPVNAGRYDVRITRAEDAEYQAVDVIITAGYVIDPKPVAEPVLTGSYTYNGRQQTAALSVVETYMTVSGDSGTAAATYTIRITLDGNHIWAEGSDGEIAWTIGKGQAEIRLEVDESAVIEHTGDSWTLPEAVCALGPVLCDRTEADMRDADTYTVTYSVAGTDNYYGDSVSVTIRILPKEVTLVWQQVAETNFVYDGTAKTVSASVAADSLAYAGDSCTVTATLTQGADNVSAGTFTFTATSLGNGNYRLPEAAQSPEYTIAPKEIVIDWAADDFTYTGEEQTISASYKDVEGQEIELAVTTDRPFLGAGSYTARAAFAGGETNYALPDSPVCVFTMQKATYDMSGVSFADGTFVEDGTAKRLSVAGSLPDGVTVVYDNNGQTASGVYTVTARFVYDTDNYNALSPMTATLTVNRAQLTARADESAGSPDVIVTADNGLAPDLQLVIMLSDEVDETVGNEIGRQERSAGVYGVRLLSDGIDVQPDGEIVLRLAIPDSVGDRSFRILHIHEGAATEVEYTIEGEYAVIRTDRLSDFVFVADDSGSAMWLILVLGGLLLIEIIAVIAKKAAGRRDAKLRSVSGFLFGGVLAVWEIVLVTVLAVAVVLLGLYTIRLYLPKKRMAAAETAAATDDTTDTARLPVNLPETVVAPAADALIAVPAAYPAPAVSDRAVVVTADGRRIIVRYNRSFVAKLIQCDDAVRRIT